MVVVALVAVCPPELTSFDVEREELHGITKTVGFFENDTSIMNLEYQDNRNSVVDRFDSQGFVHVQAKFFAGLRRIEYRHEVNIPRSNEYTVVVNNENDPWFGEFDVCAEDGKFVLYASRLSEFHLPRVTVWSVSVYFEELSGDINGDGVIDATDLAILLGDFGISGGSADLNLDGVVNGQDVGVLFNNWS